MLLQTQNLSVEFKIKSHFLSRKVQKVKALNQVNFCVDAGKVIAVVGESGSGKSTLAHTMMGLYPHFTGEIFYENQAIKSLQDFEKMREKVQLVFQDFSTSLNPRNTIFDVIAEHLKYKQKSYFKSRIRAKSRANSFESWIKYWSDGTLPSYVKWWSKTKSTNCTSINPKASNFNL